MGIFDWFSSNKKTTTNQVNNSLVKMNTPLTNQGTLTSEGKQVKPNIFAGTAMLGGVSAALPKAKVPTVKNKTFVEKQYDTLSQSLGLQKSEGTKLEKAITAYKNAKAVSKSLNPLKIIDTVKQAVLGWNKDDNPLLRTLSISESGIKNLKSGTTGIGDWINYGINKVINPTGYQVSPMRGGTVGDNLTDIAVGGVEMILGTAGFMPILAFETASSNPYAKVAMNTISEAGTQLGNNMKSSPLGGLATKLGVSEEQQDKFFNLVGQMVAWGKTMKSVSNLEGKFTKDLVAKETQNNTYNADIKTLFGEKYLEKNAYPSIEQINSRFKELAKLLHPDRVTGNKELFQKANEARTRLLENNKPSSIIDIDATIGELMKSDYAQLKEYMSQAINLMKAAKDYMGKPKGGFVSFEGKEPESFDMYASEKLRTEALKKKEAGEVLSDIEQASLFPWEKEEYLEWEKEQYKQIEKEIKKSIDPSIERLEKSVQKIEAREQRLGYVGNKKIIDAEVKKQQSIQFAKDKERLIEEIGEIYNVDQFEAVDIYDRMANARVKEKTVTPKISTVPEGVKVKKVGDMYRYSVNGTQGKGIYKTHSEASLAGEKELLKAKEKQKMLEKGIGQKKNKILSPQEKVDYINKKSEELVKDMEKKGVKIDIKPLTVDRAERKAGEEKPIKESDKLVAKSFKPIEPKAKKKLLKSKFEGPKYPKEKGKELYKYPLKKMEYVDKVFPTVEGKRVLPPEWYNENVMTDTNHNTVELMKSIKEGAKDIIISAGTRLKMISLGLGTAIEKAMYRIDTGKLHYALQLEKLGKMKKALKKQNFKAFSDLNFALLNRDKTKVQEVTSKYPGLQEEINTGIEIFKNIKEEALNVGKKFYEMEDYRPREVRDFMGLISHIEKTLLTGEGYGLIERAWKEYANKVGKAVSQLSPQEKAKIADSMLKGYPQQGIRLNNSHFKSRKIDILDKDTIKYYYDFMDSALLYINKVIPNIEFTRAFGGKNETMQDIEGTIGEAILNDKSISPELQVEARKLIKSGLNPAPTNKTIALMKNFGYMVTLGNYMSTLTQLGDLGFSLYENGPKYTLKALGYSVFKPEDVGIGDINIEMADNQLGRRALDSLFKTTGFRKSDFFGKKIMVNSTLYRLADMANTDPGRLLSELSWWGFADKFDNISERLKKVDDIMKNPSKYGKTDKERGDLIRNIVDDNIKNILYNKVGEYQPLNNFRMPIGYLNHGGLVRLFYQMKTFQLARLDKLYTTVKKQYVEAEKYEKIGDKKNASKYRRRGWNNAVKLAAILLITGTSVQVFKEWIKGKKISVKKLLLREALGFVGTSTYDLRGGPSDWFSALTSPILLDKATDAYNDIKYILNIGDVRGKGDNKKPIKIGKLKTFRMLPWLGDLPYYWLGGAKKYNENFGKKWKTITIPVSEESSSSKNKPSF